MPPPPSAPSSKPRKPPWSTALEHDRTGAVAEEDERRAVAPVEDLREHVAADDERALCQPGGEHRVRLRDRVDEACAAGREVVRGGVGHPERVGEQRRRRRERHVRRDGRDDQQIDRRRIDAGHLERAACRPAGRCRSSPRSRLRDPPLADPRPLTIHSSVVSTSFDEIVVRDARARARAPEARDRDRAAVRPCRSLRSPTANVSVPRTAS